MIPPEILGEADTAQFIQSWLARYREECTETGKIEVIVGIG
jgi:hypothetical protein